MSDARPIGHDVDITNQGSLVTMMPLTEAAVAWFDTHTPDAMRFGFAIVVEPRYVVDIVGGLVAEGLVTKWV